MSGQVGMIFGRVISVFQECKIRCKMGEMVFIKTHGESGRKKKNVGGKMRLLAMARHRCVSER